MKRVFVEAVWVSIITPFFSLQVFSQSQSAIQFWDSAGTARTGKIGWSGDAVDGGFRLEEPNGKTVTVKDGKVNAAKFSGDGSELTNLPWPPVSATDVQGLDDSLDAKSDTTYSINSEGDSGQVWKSDGSGRGYWGSDEKATTSDSASTVLSHEWNGTELRLQNSDRTWGEWVDLRGEKGDSGETGPIGPSGATGPMPAHRWSGTKIQFETSENTWGSEVDLIGPKGDSYFDFVEAGVYDTISLRFPETLKCENTAVFRDVSAEWIRATGIRCNVTALSNQIFPEDTSAASKIGNTSTYYTDGFIATLHTTNNVTNSDSRFKRSINDVNSALRKVKKLHGVSFEWDRNAYPSRHFPEGRHLGLIAQDVERTVPEVIHTDSLGYKSIAYNELVALLIEAIKEQQAQIENLRSRIDSDHQ